MFKGEKQRGRAKREKENGDGLVVKKTMLEKSSSGVLLLVLARGPTV